RLRPAVHRRADDHGPVGPGRQRQRQRALGIRTRPRHGRLAMSSTPSGGPDPAATDVIEPGQAPQTGDPAADLAASGGAAELMADSIGDYARIWWRGVRS